MRSPLRTLTRRGLLTGTVGSAALLATAGTLAGCGTKGAQQTEAGCKSEDLSATEKKVAFSNWPQYMDTDEKDESKRPTLDAFVAATGIQVTYTEDVNDNNEFFGKVRNQLAGCQSTGRDIMVLTDWMAARVIRLGWVQKLDKSKMPNVEANLLQSLRGRSFDAETQLAVPWQSGLAGLAYNAKRHQGDPHRRRAAHPPRSQGQGDCAVGDARHHRPAAPVARPRPGQVHLGPVRRRAEQAEEGRGQQADPAVHRQRLRARPGQGRHRRVHRLVRRRGPARLRRREDQVRGARVRRDALVGQHAGAEQGHPQGQRRGVDEPLLRPGGGGEAGRVRQLHLPGAGRAGRDGEDRPGPGRPTR